MIRLLLSATAGAGVGLLVLDRGRPEHRPVRDPLRALTATGRRALGPVVTGGVAWLLLGSPAVAGIAAAAVLVLTPAVAVRERRRRADRVTDAWPQLLDEARVLVGAGGLSLAQALFTAGRRAAPDLRAAWGEAERTWRLSADLPRALDVLVRELDDPTSRLVCSTLRVIDGAGGDAQHEQLARLALDRRRDASTRRTAEAQLAGARFARRFVVIMPIGMAVAGQAVGTGREAFASAPGQAAGAAAVVVTVLCWLWSGRLLAVPTTPGPSS